MSAFSSVFNALGELRWVHNVGGSETVLESMCDYIFPLHGRYSRIVWTEWYRFKIDFLPAAVKGARSYIQTRT